MKRRWSITVVLVVIGALAFLYSGCANPQNTNNANVVAIATPEPMPDKAAIEAELTRIENDWPRILKERDAAAVKRIETDDIILVYPNGVVGSKEQDVKDIEAGNLSFESWSVSDLKVNVLDADAAVVTFLITVKNGKFQAKGEAAQDISGHFRAVDTFVRRNGQWQIAASAVTKLSREVEQGLSADTKPAASPTPKASPSTKPAPAAKAPPPVRSSSPAAKTSPAVKASPKAAPVRTSTP